MNGRFNRTQVYELLCLVCWITFFFQESTRLSKTGFNFSGSVSSSLAPTPLPSLQSSYISYSAAARCSTLFCTPLLNSLPMPPPPTPLPPTSTCPYLPLHSSPQRPSPTPPPPRTWSALTHNPPSLQPSSCSPNPTLNPRFPNPLYTWHLPCPSANPLSWLIRLQLPPSVPKAPLNSPFKCAQLPPRCHSFRPICSVLRCTLLAARHSWRKPPTLLVVIDRRCPSGRKLRCSCQNESRACSNSWIKLAGRWPRCSSATVRKTRGSSRRRWNSSGSHSSCSSS